MRYRTQSASVLNEADRFQAILDWQLFVHEQERMLWGDNPKYFGPWRPGDPIEKAPWLKALDFDRRLDMDEDIPEEDWWDGPMGNHPRPMFQVYDFVSRDEMIGWGPQTRIERSMTYPIVRCEPCGVSWDATVAECWVCGTEYPTLAPIVYKKGRTFSEAWVHNHAEPLGNIFDIETVEVRADGVYANMRLRDEITWGLEREMGEAWRNLMQGMLESSRNARRGFHQVSNSMRGLSASLVIFDEYTDYDVDLTRQLWLRASEFNGDTVVRFHPPTRSLSPFESPEDEVQIELVPPVAPDTSAPITYTWRSVRTIERRLMEAGSSIFERPMPEVPRFHTPSYNYQGNWARTTINTPIARQRRRRNV